jgi:hypothetical protein
VSIFKKRITFSVEWTIFIISHIYCEAVAGDLMHIFWNLLFGWLVLLASVSYAGWTPPARISDVGPSYSPRIAANSDTLHVVYWVWTGHAECYYLRSIDEGISWASPFYLSDPPISSGEDSPEIHAKGDTIMAAWYQDIAGSGVNLGFRKSSNGGGDGAMSLLSYLRTAICCRNMTFAFLIQSYS